MRSILATKPPKIVEGVLNGDIFILIFKKFPKDYRGWVYLYCANPKQNHYHLQKVVDVDNDFKEEYELDYYISDDYSACLERKVVARFYCDNVGGINHWNSWLYTERSGLSDNEIEKYLDDENYIIDLRDEDEVIGYAVHISQLEIFDKPKELSEFYKANKQMEYIKSLWNAGGFPDKDDYDDVRLIKAPRNFCYIEVEE